MLKAGLGLGSSDARNGMRTLLLLTGCTGGVSLDADSFLAVGVFCTTGFSASAFLAPRVLFTGGCSTMSPPLELSPSSCCAFGAQGGLGSGLRFPVQLRHRNDVRVKLLFQCLCRRGSILNLALLGEHRDGLSSSLLGILTKHIHGRGH